MARSRHCVQLIEEESSNGEVGRKRVESICRWYLYLLGRDDS